MLGCAPGADLEDLADVDLDPIGEDLDVGGGFRAEWREAVLDFGWDGGEDGSTEKAVSFELLKRLGEHFFADAADGAAELREAVRAFEKQDEDERAPARGEVVKHATGGAGGGVEIALAGFAGEKEARGTGAHASSLPEGTSLRKESERGKVSSWMCR